jgi:hypothetical protein
LRDIVVRKLKGETKEFEKCSFYFFLLFLLALTTWTAFQLGRLQPLATNYFTAHKMTIFGKKPKQ